MLIFVINGYQNKVLIVVEVIDELIKFVKIIQEFDSFVIQLNFSVYEYVFYFVVVDNDSVCELMEKEKL